MAEAEAEIVTLIEKFTPKNVCPLAGNSVGQVSK